MSAVSVSLALLARISRTRFNPIFSTEPPALLPVQASKAPSLATSAAQSASVSEVLSPSSGLTAAAWSVASAPAQAGLTPCARGSGVVCPHLGEGETGDVRVRGGQVFGRQREEFLLLAIQRVH